MAYPFKGFKATRPIARLIDPVRTLYDVFFIVYPDSGPKKQIRFQKDINESERPPERKQKAEELVFVLWEALQKGWDPTKEKYPCFAKQEQRLNHYTFSTALDHAIALKKPSLSRYSVYDFEGTVRFMKEAARKCGCDNAPLRSIKRKDIRMIVATAKELNEWSSNARNKYFSLLRSLLTALVDNELLEYNPAKGIKNEVSAPGPGYKRLTDDELARVVDHLTVIAPAFLEYFLFIYHDGIRRTELLQVKVKDIDIVRRQITIRAEVAKTNRQRHVPINDELMQILVHREIWKCPKDWYLFSNSKFNPGPVPYHPNVPTEWWYKYVQTDLKIDCKLYSGKHKGADDKIKAGVPLLALKQMYGHKSEQMTQIYADAVKEQYMQQIIDKSPTLAKVIYLQRKAQ